MSDTTIYGPEIRALLGTASRFCEADPPLYTPFLIGVESRRERSFTDRYSSQFKNSYFTKVCSGSEAGLYLRLVDFGITQL